MASSSSSSSRPRPSPWEGFGRRRTRCGGSGWRRCAGGEKDAGGVLLNPAASRAEGHARTPSDASEGDEGGEGREERAEIDPERGGARDGREPRNGFGRPAPSAGAGPSTPSPAKKKAKKRRLARGRRWAAKGERETIRRGGWQEELVDRTWRIVKGDAQLHGPRGRGTVRDDEKVLLFNGESICEPV